LTIGTLGGSGIILGLASGRIGFLAHIDMAIGGKPIVLSFAMPVLNVKLVSLEIGDRRSG